MGSLPNVIYPDIKINSFTSLPNNDTSWILDFLNRCIFFFSQTCFERLLKAAQQIHKDTGFSC